MKKLILIIISALTALTLCACGQEETPAEPTPVPTLEFASGSYPVDAESLRIVVTADEMPRMDEFTALKAVDFTGSDCYEAIDEYIASHSGVRVSLRGEFPNGESFSLRSTEAKLAGIAPENIDECMAILRLIPGLETIDLGTAPEEGEDASAALGWDEVGAFQAAFPDKAVRYGFTLFGKQLTTLDEQMVLSHRRMDDEGAAVLAVLPYMTRCTFLDMDSCGVSNTAMAAIRDAYPDIKVVWRVWFGDVYTCRTDVKRLLASSESHYINDATSDGLYYCTDVVWLDIGHSSLYDLSFLYNMPDLEVCIVACAPWSDATPIGSLEKLEYLEILSTNCNDISSFANLKNLKHLNIGNCWQIRDITPLYGLTQLERLWIGCVTPVPAEQKEEIREKLPDTLINTQVANHKEGGWCKDENGYNVPRYALLREQFGDYKSWAYAYPWSDILYTKSIDELTPEETQQIKP